MINERKKQALDCLKLAIRKSIREKYDNDKLSIINFDVISKTKHFSSIGIDTNDLLAMLIETVTELEATKFALNSCLESSGKVRELIETYHDAEKSSDELHEFSENAIYELGGAVVDLKSEVENKSKEFAKKGGVAKSKKYEPLIKKAIELYEGGKWNSKREAARKIENEIIELARITGIPLSGDQPWETIHKWLLKHIKK